MNILGYIQLLEKAYTLYQELQKSGVLAKVAASVEQDKLILDELKGNANFNDFVDHVETLFPQHPQQPPAPPAK